MTSLSLLPEIGALDTWVIDDELSTLSDHEVIIIDNADPDGSVESIGIS